MHECPRAGMVGRSSWVERSSAVGRCLCSFGYVTFWHKGLGSVQYRRRLPWGPCTCPTLHPSAGAQVRRTYLGCDPPVATDPRLGAGLVRACVTGLALGSAGAAAAGETTRLPLLQPVGGPLGASGTLFALALPAFQAIMAAARTASATPRSRTRQANS